MDAVNGVFSRIMSREIGGIAYDDKAALYPGAVYPAQEDPAYGSELLLIRKPERESAKRAASESSMPRVRESLWITIMYDSWKRSPLPPV